jgi:hypothetical protein
MEDSNECSVCAETYNDRLRTKITCDACDYSACKECYKTVIASIITSPYCINCELVFTRETLINKFSKYFVTKVINPAVKRFLLADTINKWGKYFVEYKEKTDRLKKTREIICFRIEEINKELSGIKMKEFDIEDNDSKRIIESVEYSSFTDYISNRKKMYISHIRGIDSRILGAVYSIVSVNRTPTTKKTEVILRKCIDTNCDGYQIRNKCNKCSKEVCTKCREELKESHVCDPNTVLTVEALSVDSTVKKCPKCDIYIHRIEGCSQMWCTHCNVAFSWTTGRVINSNVHFDNPHYTAFMRTTRQTDNCERPTAHVIFTKLNSFGKLSRSSIERRELDLIDFTIIKEKTEFNEICSDDMSALSKCIFRLFQAMLHINGVQTRKMVVTNQDADHVKKIFAHINGDITADKTATYLHTLHKKNLFKNDMFNVVEYFKFGTESISNEIMHLSSFEPSMNDMLTKIKNLVNTTNEMFVKIYDTYEMTTMQINFQFLWVKYNGSPVFGTIYKNNEINY